MSGYLWCKSEAYFCPHCHLKKWLPVSCEAEDVTDYTGSCNINDATNYSKFTDVNDTNIIYWGNFVSEKLILGFTLWWIRSDAIIDVKLCYLALLLCTSKENYKRIIVADGTGSHKRKKELESKRNFFQSEKAAVTNGFHHDFSSLTIFQSQLKYKITAGLEANILIPQTMETTPEKMSRNNSI
ncbi:hypothetical protein CHUAL_013969 [Chamberlinius hualienensis]